MVFLCAQNINKCQKRNPNCFGFLSFFVQQLMQKRKQPEDDVDFYGSLSPQALVSVQLLKLVQK